jgi:sulfate adenylyltransferase
MTTNIVGINPHGGKLVNRVIKKDPAGLFSISINQDMANDVENIADGIFSPLEGFLGQEDFERVISKGRLANELAWTMPTVLDVDDETAKKMKEAGDVLLKDPQGTGMAILHVEETFSFDKEKMVLGVYGTVDTKHPGVEKTNAMKEILVSGRIDLIQRPEETEIRKFRMTPSQTRKVFEDAGWKTIVAFQTRNPPHVAHEMLQKTAITTRDGVFINPLVGRKKSGDFVDQVIVKCYETLIKHYYPQNRCKLATLHTEMKYAGPKEAEIIMILLQHTKFLIIIQI